MAKVWRRITKGEGDGPSGSEVAVFVNGERVVARTACPEEGWYEDRLGRMIIAAYELRDLRPESNGAVIAVSSTKTPAA